MIKILKNLKKIIFSQIRIFYYNFFINDRRKKKFLTDIKNFEKKIKKKINFAYSRFSDGELFILQNKKLIISKNFWQLDDKKIYYNFPNDDKKAFYPNKHQFYRLKLIKSLKFTKKNYFKGISCSCCHGQKNLRYIRNILDNKKNLTFSNLFQNGNYNFFITRIVKLFKKKKIILIANKNANLDNLPFKVLKKFNIGENCLINNYQLINTLKNFIKKKYIKNHLFLISAASLSNIIIYELFKENNKNTYLDIGSTLNYFFNKENVNSRSYLNEYWGKKKNNIEFLNRNCYW